MTADSSRPAWVVGVDGSPVADEAVSWAVRHATGRTSQIRLVTAWQASMHGTAIDADIESREANKINTTAVAAARQLLPERGAHSVPAVDAQVIHRGASVVLLDASERGSLLIIGNRGRGALARLISGSTSNQCTAHAVVPTVVVPAHRDKVGGTIARASAIGAALLGSVSASVLRHVDAPTVVVP